MVQELEGEEGTTEKTNRFIGLARCSFMGYISDDYHDYVFKGGKCIGLFDEMYKYSKDVPWHQDEMAFRWYTEVGMLMLRDIVRERNKRFSRALEIGCGLGYIISRLGPYAEQLFGCDISEIALDKARQLHKSVDFFLWDIGDKNSNKEKYDLVLMVEVIWYVLDRLETVKDNLDSLLPRGGYFLFKQSFPDLNKPFVGKDIFPSPKELMEFWSNFEMIYSCEIKTCPGSQESHLWFLGRKK